MILAMHFASTVLTLTTTQPRKSTISTSIITQKGTETQ